jgi:hypothetical protein
MNAGKARDAALYSRVKDLSQAAATQGDAARVALKVRIEREEAGRDRELEHARAMLPPKALPPPEPDALCP